MNKILLEACLHYKKHNDLLSFIKKVHESYGYLTTESIKDIAFLWNVSVGEVYGLITFYSFFSIKPAGQNIIKVCKSTLCYLKNCENVIKAIERKLGITPGKVTQDRKFSLHLVNCIGACDGAPAIMVNNEVYSSLTPKKIEEILERYKKCSAKPT